MQVALPTKNLAKYHSASQRARIASEGWAARNLYCAECTSNELEPSAANTPAVDFVCGACRASFQLKCQSQPIGARIVDAAYSAMIRSITSAQTPNLFVMSYDRTRWRVENVILVPRFAFSLSAIERRPPLGPAARRAGWVGCMIVLENIPIDAKISLIAEGIAVSPRRVREQYSRLRPLGSLRHEKRGWTLDVLKAVRALGTPEFTLAHIYQAEAHLKSLHPGNLHVRDKIRQQLQILRDAGFLEFEGRGRYRLL